MILSGIPDWKSSVLPIEGIGPFVNVHSIRTRKKQLIGIGFGKEPIAATSDHANRLYTSFFLQKWVGSENRLDTAVRILAVGMEKGPTLRRKPRPL